MTFSPLSFLPVPLAQEWVQRSPERRFPSRTQGQKDPEKQQPHPFPQLSGGLRASFPGAMAGKPGFPWRGEGAGDLRVTTEPGLVLSISPSPRRGAPVQRCSRDICGFSRTCAASLLRTTSCSERLRPHTSGPEPLGHPGSLAAATWRSAHQCHSDVGARARELLPSLPGSLNSVVPC